MDTKETKSVVLDLKNDRGNWVGTVFLTNEGDFSAITDYGNFGYRWSSTGGDFVSFLLSLNIDYFGTKMQESVGYQFGTSKQIKQSCIRFSEIILPILQQHLKNELGKNNSIF